jgi:hypothetical protein
MERSQESKVMNPKEYCKSDMNPIWWLGKECSKRECKKCEHRLGCLTDDVYKTKMMFKFFSRQLDGAIERSFFYGDFQCKGHK